MLVDRRTFLSPRFFFATALRFSSKDFTPLRTSLRHKVRFAARSSHSVWFSPEDFRDVFSSSINLFLGVPIFRLPSRSSPNIICLGKRLLSILATWPAQRSLFRRSKDIQGLYTAIQQNSIKWLTAGLNTKSMRVPLIRKKLQYCAASGKCRARVIKCCRLKNV